MGLSKQVDEIPTSNRRLTSVEGHPSATSPKHPGRTAWMAHAALTLLLICAAGSAVVTPVGGSRAGANNATPDPIVFVHGFGGSIGGHELFFSAGMVPWLKSQGFPADHIFVFTYDADESIYDVMPRLESFIDGALRSTGADKVDLVTHSKGGLIARGYVALLGGSAHVDGFAAIASTLSGGEIPFCGQLPIGQECLNNLPNSPLVNKLNALDPTPGPARYATWWSRCDGVVKPVLSATLPGADNHEQPCDLLSGLANNHLTMPLNPRIWNEVYGFVAS